MKLNKLKMGGLILGGIAGTVATAWGGFLFPPRPFAKPVSKPIDDYVRLPAGLPVPVRKHYAQTVEEGIPVVETAVFTGRAWIRTIPQIEAWMRMRFAAYHLLGRNFLRQMEVTWFNMPLVSGKDTYIDDVGVMDINGKVEKGPHIDQGENMAMWAEALVVPSVLLQEESLHWQTVDAHTVQVEFPFEDGFDHATLKFDPVTGFLSRFSGGRHKTRDCGKVGWHVEYLNWQAFHGIYLPKQITVQWEDEETPWFVATMDDIALNVALPPEMEMEGAVEALADEDAAVAEVAEA